MITAQEDNMSEPSISTASACEMPIYHSKDPGVAEIASTYTEQAVVVATSFTCFLELPLEMQRNIWRFACFIPRNIDLWPVKRGNASESVSWFSHAAMPDVLHACHEARSEGLRYYSLDFGIPTTGLSGRSVSAPSQIYVNWECDMICYMSDNKEENWNSGWEDRLILNLTHEYPKMRRFACAPTPNNDQWIPRLITYHILDEVILFNELGTRLDWLHTYAFRISDRVRLEILPLDQGPETSSANEEVHNPVTDLQSTVAWYEERDDTMRNTVRDLAYVKHFKATTEKEGDTLYDIIQNGIPELEDGEGDMPQVYLVRALKKCLPKGWKPPSLKIMNVEALTSGHDANADPITKSNEVIAEHEC